MTAATGLRIISVAKTLEAFQSGDSMISQYFGAARLAGRGGLFASSLRSHTRMSFDKFLVLASEARLDRPTVSSTILPWLRRSGFVETDAASTIVNCNVVDYTAILKATHQLFEASLPTVEERAVLVVLELATRMPATQSEVFKCLSGESDGSIAVAMELASNYGIVKVAHSEGVAEPIVYSPLIWGDNIAKASRALSHMDRIEREVLLSLLSLVSQHQGMPESFAKQWLAKQQQDKLCEFAISIGLLDRTEILTRSGGRQAFLTTPHIYGEIAVAHGRDVCDRVRLFLDSIRHGEHYGAWATGRIRNPVVLLDSLLRNGEIGPCSAIGTDYILVEKAGIVTVERSSYKPGQFTMKLVQEDTVRLIRDILSNSHGIGLSPQASAGGQHAQQGFVSAEQCRPRLGKLPEPMKEAEKQMLRMLREIG